MLIPAGSAAVAVIGMRISTVHSFTDPPSTELTLASSQGGGMSGAPHAPSDPFQYLVSLGSPPTPAPVPVNTGKRWMRRRFPAAPSGSKVRTITSLLSQLGSWSTSKPRYRLPALRRARTRAFGIDVPLPNSYFQVPVPKAEVGQPGSPLMLPSIVGVPVAVKHMRKFGLVAQAADDGCSRTMAATASAIQNGRWTEARFMSHSPFNDAS